MLNSRQFRYQSQLFLKHDLPAGLTVFFVAMPLCLGIALASGAPLQAGIMSGIIGGLVVSFLSGSQLSVSGPAAGLTTVVGAMLLAYNNPAVVMAIVITAGALQLILGLLKLGKIASYFPSSVIKGMLAAIGIILISKQLPVALGYGQPDFWSKEFINLISDTHLFTNLKEFYENISLGAVVITLFSLAAYALWEKTRPAALKFIPIPLFVVMAGIGINLIFRYFIPSLELKANALVQLPAALLTGLALPDFNGFIHDFKAIKYALVIAVLASLETLLCLEAVDKIDPQHRTSPPNRELVAQGIGNMLCGLVGALPITAVIVRGAANVDAGARTNKAAFMHGFFLLLAVLGIPFIINQIPLAALASILVVTGFKLTLPKLYKSMFKLGLNQFLPFVITVVVILFTDLLMGVTIGLIISVLFIIRNNYKAEFDMKKETKLGITTYTITLHTNVTFVDKVKMKELLTSIPGYSKVVIDGALNKHTDYDVLEMITEYAENAKRHGKELELIGIEKVSITAIH
jgi:MFS superfamily sulfate permease-like transporter